MRVPWEPKAGGIVSGRVGKPTLFFAGLLGLTWAAAQATPRWTIAPTGGQTVGTPVKTLPSAVKQSGDKQVWWSFRAPKPPPVPKCAGQTWVRNPIDRFILARLQESGLKPSPQAPRSVLIRRAVMDIVGLPPTPREVAAFVADRSPNAWEKVVDRLLASPHYGERWARHWLDLARYADSGGFEGDKDRPLAWRYRDYVVAAFNKDKPYTDFVREQIAGDEIRPDDPDAWIATGYLAAGQQDLVGMNMAEQRRADELDDLVATTGQVFLGLTMGCARCHDHKYDPIKQTDYYRLAAVFAPTTRNEIDLPGEETRRIDAQNVPLDQELARLQAQLDALKTEGKRAAQAAGKIKPDDVAGIAALSPTAHKQWEDLDAARKATEAKKIARPRALVVTDSGTSYGEMRVNIRGDAHHLGEVVQPGFVCSLPGGSATVAASAHTEKTTGRRRALADWLTSPENPLLARVWINRVWRQHFGKGIVNTPSNFGVSGELPSHPELLDWLTCAFIRNGYHLKPLQKMILMSATYQQASEIHPDAFGRDPQNRLLWRMPVRRLEAEAIRDSLLSVAGTLNEAFGGPAVYPPVDPSLRADTFQGINWPEGEDSPKTWRRSLYIKVKRSLLLPELEVFDCPEISATVAARNVTTTPTQALTLLNDPLILRQSGLFAQRLEHEAGKDPRKQITLAYQLAFCRVPTPREMELSLAFLKSRKAPANPLADFCHAIINLNEFIYVP